MRSVTCGSASPDEVGSGGLMVGVTISLLERATGNSSRQCRPLPLPAGREGTAGRTGRGGPRAAFCCLAVHRRATNCESVWVRFAILGLSSKAGCECQLHLLEAALHLDLRRNQHRTVQPSSSNRHIQGNIELWATSISWSVLTDEFA